MESEKDDSYESRDRSLKRETGILGDTRTARDDDDRNQYETGHFERDTDPSISEESRSQEDSDPYLTVLKLGSEMNGLFTEWSQEFAISKNFEDGTIKKMENLKKEAYMLEAEFLESKLAAVKKRISET